MAILTGPQIADEIRRGSIVIDPVSMGSIGPNSVDVHLGEVCRYKQMVLNPRGPLELEPIRADNTGMYSLCPGRLYIASIREYTETQGFVPRLDGRSSIGRLGVSIHSTAGQGDDGFCGRWTMEISVIQPVLLPAGVRIGQITYHTIKGKRQPYNGRYHRSIGPVGSRLTE